MAGNMAVRAYAAFSGRNSHSGIIAAILLIIALLLFLAIITQIAPIGGINTNCTIYSKYAKICTNISKYEQIFAKKWKI